MPSLPLRQKSTFWTNNLDTREVISLSLSPPSRPFSVSPSTGTLSMSSCMQVDVFYVPREVGNHSGELLIHYSTGETVYTKLYGYAKDVNVYLDRSSIVMDDTFFGLSSQR